MAGRERGEGKGWLEGRRNGSFLPFSRKSYSAHIWKATSETTKPSCRRAAVGSHNPILYRRNERCLSVSLLDFALERPYLLSGLKGPPPSSRLLSFCRCSPNPLSARHSTRSYGPSMSLKSLEIKSDRASVISRARYNTCAVFHRALERVSRAKETDTIETIENVTRRSKNRGEREEIGRTNDGIDRRNFNYKLCSGPVLPLFSLLDVISSPSALLCDTHARIANA